MNLSDLSNWTKIKGYLIHHIRLAWRYYSELRKACLRADSCAICKRSVEDIVASNKIRGLSARGKKKRSTKKPSPLVADHIVPVVDPDTGFTGFDNYIERMLLGELQALCKECHDKKSKVENATRKVKRGKNGRS